jgi:hypothetical protein
MAEIKSTLDIIMEKTKDLTMSDEEKKEFQKKETEGKMRGFLQKFLDGLIDINHLKMEVANLGEKQQPIVRETLIHECLGRIELEADNRPLLDVLENVAELETGSIRKVLSKYSQDLKEARRKREKILRTRLEETGILGTAVIPNIQADKEWIQYVAELKKRVREEMTL